MVAFVTSMLIGFAGVIGVVVYGKTRRKPGDPLTWGQAMAAATYTFFFMFWWYGIIPHLWMTWADNELNWRADNVLYGVGDFLKPEALGGWLPMTLSWQTMRDFIEVGIYGLGLGLQIWIWAWWNDRQKKADAAAAIEPTTAYGRPLVKKG